MLFQVYREEFVNENLIYFHNGKIINKKWFEPYSIKSKEISIGIDQSSTCTGLYLNGDEDKLLIEYPRDLLSVNNYKKALINELDSLIFNSRVKFFIYEVHNHISTRESPLYEITQELKKYSKQETFNDSKIKGVLPSVWRKGFLSRNNYDGSYNRKEVKVASYNQVIKEEPDLTSFYKYSHKDLDAYEAYGILKGYLNLNFDNNGNRLINTTMTYLKSRNFKYTIESLNSYELTSRLSDLTRPILLGNNEINLREACNRVLDEYIDCYILIDGSHPELPRYVIETGKPFEEGTYYLIHTIKRS